MNWAEMRREGRGGGILGRSHDVGKRDGWYR